jgi:3-oxoacyl-[acyl-carrier-protein] synthase II
VGSKNMTSRPTNNKRPTVVVTGMGIITSLGLGKADNWKRLAAGQSGIHRIARFANKGLKTTVCGSVDFIPVEPFCSTELGERMAVIVAEEAIAEACIGSKGNFPGPLFLAVAPAELEWPHRETLAAASGANAHVGYQDLLRASGAGRFHAIHERCVLGSVGEHLAERFGTKGSPVSVTTACASGASAIQLGIEALRRGEAQAALCIGTDGSVNPECLIRFSLLSALSTANDPPEQAAKPFSKNRDGFVMAEGAAALVIETHDSAKARGAKILGVLAGCGEMSDSFHRTRSRPDGKAIIGCIHRALADSGLAPDEIDYINPHGTGTPENDRMEYVGISAVFGKRAGAIPVSSNKSMVGHTLSAAGVVEAVFTLMTLQQQRLPPTINYRVPDPAIPLDVVPNVARDAKVRHALSNSFGFGGQNVSLVISGEPG